MLRPRIIPCLLLTNGGLVKTVQFKDPKYVGDPLNAVRIFNEKEVDELTILDIDASANNLPPRYDLIQNIAAECRMPLCYGGGVKTSDEILKLVSMGVEKVAISSAAIHNQGLITEAANKVGNQSIVVVIDVKVTANGEYKVFTNNGKIETELDPAEFASKVEKLGAGEIVVNSIDRDGTMEGYDVALLKKIRSAVNIPMTAIGGAGKLDHIAELVKEFGSVGASAGSLFVFKGIYRAVLINYPDRNKRTEICRQSL